jgi:hypothetical protein
VKLEARARWIRGGKSDEAIARELGTRPATMRAWKQRENWPALRDQLHGIVADEVRARVLEERAELNHRHLNLADALEGMIVRAMRERAPDGSPTLDPAGIRSLATALAATQRVKRVATGIDHLPTKAAEFGPTKIVFEPAVPPPESTRGVQPSDAA